MNKLFLFLFFNILFPLSVLAATGFVPSSGIWFSRTSFYPNESIRIFTIVVNNDYVTMNGTVGFYDNGNLISSVEVSNLNKESAQEIKTYWQPKEGQHSVTAGFIKAVSVDANGVKKEIPLENINGITGAPLVISTTAASTSPQTVSKANIEVKKEGDKLVLSTPPVTSETPAQSAEPRVEETGQPEQNSTVQTAVATASDLFAKNKQVLDNAGNFIATVSSTAAKAAVAYNGAKSVVEKGQTWYDKGQEQWDKAQPYVDKAKPFWNKISNNNEPKRIAIIVAALLIGYWLIKRAIRPKYHRDYGEYR